MTATRLGRLPVVLIAVLAGILFLAHATGLRNLLAGLLTLAVLGAAVRQRRLPLPSPFIALWVGLCLLSALWSVVPGVSFGDALTSVALPAASGLAAYRWLKRDDIVPWVVYPLLAGLTLLLLLRLAYIGLPLTPPWLASLYTYWPGRGVMSTLAILVLPLGAWLLATGKRRLGAALLLLALVAGMQNWNRMFWIAAFVTLFPCLFMGRLQRWLLLAIVALGLVAAAGGTYYAIAQKAPGQTAAEAFRSDERWRIWQAWGGVAAERPWLGYGYGPRTTNRVGADKNLPESLGLGRGHPHNLLFGILVQLGGVGLLLFLATLGDLARRFARRCAQAESRAAAMAGIALLAGLLAKNMTDDFFYHSAAAMFWLQLGIFLKLSRAADE